MKSVSGDLAGGNVKKNPDYEVDGALDSINLMSQIMSRHSDLILRLVYQNRLLHNYRSWEQFLNFLMTHQRTDPEICQLVNNVGFLFTQN